MLSELDTKRITEFFAGIAPWEAAYKHAGLSYFAFKHDGDFVLLQARLFLRIVPSNVPSSYFQSSNIRVGHYLMSDLGQTAHAVVDELLSGKLSTPHGILRFSPGHADHYSVGHVPFHYEGHQSGMRVSVLTLTGAQCGHLVDQWRLDWELKAAPTPYDNLNELLVEYGLGGYSTANLANIELIASPACEVDVSVQIKGITASPAVLMADQLDSKKCSLGYRVFQQGKVVKRAMVDGTQMHWESRPHILRGSADIEIPAGAVMQCFATYDGYTQHQGWITDPSTVQNPNRAVYEAFDSQLAILRDFLENSQGKGRDARDLEAGIAWLLWMLGFSVAHLGGTAKTQDAPDLVATTPRGNFVVIECTTGLLKADNKLPRLVERAGALRTKLDASGNRHLRVLPVIISSKNREEIRADLEQAEKLGVLVLTKESLRQAIDRTLVRQDAEQIYAEGERVVREQQGKYSQGQLPLGTG
jgi:hypothetical protein